MLWQTCIISAQTSAVLQTFCRSVLQHVFIDNKLIMFASNAPLAQFYSVNVERMNCFTCTGYSEEAPMPGEEEELLSQLVVSCFSCSREEIEELLSDLTSLARAQAQCRETGVPQPQIQAVSEKVSQAISDLKRKVRPRSF